MTIEEQLNEELKVQMRARQQDAVACIRQLKSKVQEVVNAKGFTGPIDDSLYQRVIATYCKSLEKGIVEMAPAGDRSQALRDKYQAEINFLQRYMPQLLSESATRELVGATVTRLGVTDPKQAGRVLGALMKDHKGLIDPVLTKKLVEALLAANAP